MLIHPKVFDTISEDGVRDLPENVGAGYLCGYVPELIGCFIIHPQNRICMDVHVQVLPEHRKRWAREFGKAVIEWTWENTSAQKLVAQIPFLYPNVMEFAREMGFEVEGVNTQSFRKKGKIWDQWYMGLNK